MAQYLFQGKNKIRHLWCTPYEVPPQYHGLRVMQDERVSSTVSLNSQWLTRNHHHIVPQLRYLGHLYVPKE